MDCQPLLKFDLSHIAFGVANAHIRPMTNIPRILTKKPPEKFQAYADRERAAASVWADKLGATRDPLRKEQIEKKLQQCRERAAFNDAKAREMRDQGE
jgi:hypothetical protein